MSAFAKWTMPVLLTFASLTGCTQTPPQQITSSPAVVETKSPGVTANSGGDTRGEILYEPGPAPVNPPDPYAAVSSKIVLPLRQKMAWELAEIDLHAHQQAENAYPVPDPSTPGYSKKTALRDANHQAQFNAYLLEKYHARFCNQFGVTYDQLVLIIQEGREKNWPMPPVPKE